jgi:hypothetical protein
VSINVTLANRKQIRIAKVKEYILETLQTDALMPNCKINYERLGRISESPVAKERMLQPADWIAGSLGAGLNPNKHGAVRTNLVEAILIKFWRRTGFWIYGMKIMPTTFHIKKETLFQRIKTCAIRLEVPTALLASCSCCRPTASSCPSCLNPRLIPLPQKSSNEVANTPNPN